MGPKIAKRFSNVAFIVCPELKKPTNIPKGKETIPQTVENIQIDLRPKMIAPKIAPQISQHEGAPKANWYRNETGESHFGDLMMIHKKEAK